MGEVWKALPSARARLSRAWDQVRRYEISLEPAIVCYQCAILVLYGSEIQTNLKLWKACKLSLNNTEEVCQNLDDDANKEVQDATQVYVTNFDLFSNLVGSIPGVVYSIFAGALSDRYGRKPLFLLPMAGYLLSNFLMMINYAYIEVLPIEFFYFDGLSSVLGGNPLYYLGVYGYGADITNDSQRATRYAIYDAMEIVGVLVGTFLSPKIKKWGGNQANYGVSAALTLFALLYVKFRVKETNKEDKGVAGGGEGCSPAPFLQKYLVTPLKEFYETVTKPREGRLRVYVYILLFIYGIYWTNLMYSGQSYLYMLKVFEGFNGEKYSYYNMYHTLLGLFGLLVLLPLAANVLKFHETTTSLIINLSMVIGLTSSAFVKTLTGYYFTRFFCGFAICQYSVARALFTKCVGPKEVGKIFSAVAIVAAIGPVIGDPIFKKLYTSTLSTFPSAFMLLAAAVYAFSSGLWSFLWCNRGQMQGRDDDNEDEEDKNKEDMDSNDNEKEGRVNKAAVLEVE